jgi:hypothetical protein
VTGLLPPGQPCLHHNHRRTRAGLLRQQNIMLIVSFQTPEPDVPCEITFLSDLGNGAVLYGLYYPGFSNCVSWCYVTIAKGVIIATHTETNGHPSDSGTSITNIWSVKFLESLETLAPIKAAGKVRWFEHYHRPVPKPNRDWEARLDEVFIVAGNEREVTWKPIACDDREHGTARSVADAWEALTGVPVPDFTATGFESYMLA